MKYSKTKLKIKNAQNKLLYSTKHLPILIYITFQRPISPQQTPQPNPHIACLPLTLSLPSVLHRP